MGVTTVKKVRYTRKVGKQGGSLSVGIPAELTRKLNLSKGDEVEMAMNKDDGEIVIRKKKRELPDGIGGEFLDSLNRMLNKYDNALRNLKDR